MNRKIVSYASLGALLNVGLVLVLLVMTKCLSRYLNRILDGEPLPILTQISFSFYWWPSIIAIAFIVCIFLSIRKTYENTTLLQVIIAILYSELILFAVYFIGCTLPFASIH